MLNFHPLTADFYYSLEPFREIEPPAASRAPGEKRWWEFWK
jgi:hypothetical protein